MSSNRRSRNITEGVARAPNRSMYYAMGYTEGDFGKPMIGVANGHSTITPCNSGLQRLADAAVAELKAAGANPQIFGTPTISDGIDVYKRQQHHHAATAPEGAVETGCRGVSGGRCRVRTCDPCRVKAVLYR